MTLISLAIGSFLNMFFYLIGTRGLPRVESKKSFKLSTNLENIISCCSEGSRHVCPETGLLAATIKPNDLLTLNQGYCKLSRLCQPFLKIRAICFSSLTSSTPPSSIRTTSTGEPRRRQVWRSERRGFFLFTFFFNLMGPPIKSCPT